MTPLPDSPSTTYVAGITQVQAQDLNDLQTMAVALWGDMAFLGCAGREVGTGATAVGSVGEITIIATNHAFIPLPLPVGMKVATVDIIGKDVNGSDGLYSLVSENIASGGATSHGSVASTSSSRETRTITLGGGGHTILAAEAYSLRIDATNVSTTTVYMVVVRVVLP